MSLSYKTKIRCVVPLSIFHFLPYKISSNHNTTHGNEEKEEKLTVGLTKWEEIIWGNIEATSIPWTSRSSKPAFLADSELKCRGLESWLTLEYSKTSSLENILACLRMSPVLSMRGSRDEKYLNKGGLVESKLLINILLPQLEGILSLDPIDKEKVI